MAIYYSSAQQAGHTNGFLDDRNSTYSLPAEPYLSGKVMGVSCHLNHIRHNQTDQVDIDRWRKKQAWLD